MTEDSELFPLILLLGGQEATVLAKRLASEPSAIPWTSLRHYNLPHSHTPGWENDMIALAGRPLTGLSLEAETCHRAESPMSVEVSFCLLSCGTRTLRIECVPESLARLLRVHWRLRHTSHTADDYQSNVDWNCYANACTSRHGQKLQPIRPGEFWWHVSLFCE